MSTVVWPSAWSNSSACSCGRLSKPPPGSRHGYGPPHHRPLWAGEPQPWPHLSTPWLEGAPSHSAHPPRRRRRRRAGMQALLQAPLGAIRHHVRPAGARGATGGRHGLHLLRRSRGIVHTRRPASGRAAHSRLQAAFPPTAPGVPSDCARRPSCAPEQSLSHWALRAVRRPPWSLSEASPEALPSPLLCPAGPVMNKLVVEGNSRMCLFTGSQACAWHVRSMCMACA